MKVVRGSRETALDTKKFKVGDFWGGGGGHTAPFDISDWLVYFADDISDLYDTKIVIASTRRTKTYNAKLEGSSPTSKHLKGEAMDFGFLNRYVNYKNIDGTVDRVTLHERFVRDLFSKTKDIQYLIGTWVIQEIIIYNKFIHVGIGEGRLEIIDKRFKSVPKPKQEEVEQQIRIKKEIEKRTKEDAVKDFYEYKHLDSSVVTVQQLFKSTNSPIKFWDSGLDKFLEYSNKSGVRNIDNIWLFLDDDQRSDYSQEYKSICDGLDSDPDSESLLDKKRSFKPVISSSKQLSLPVGVILFIAKNKANIEVISAIGKNLFLEQQDFVTFQDKEYEALVNDPLYIRGNELEINGNSYSINYKRILYSCWVYIRALDEIVNVSPFVISLDTTATDKGGNFTITFNDVTDIKSLVKGSETFISYVNKVTNGEFNSSFFNKIIQQNDIVFIRFEQLALEDRESENNDFIIDKGELPGKIYDMIGLVDSNQESYNASGNSGSIVVSGRDLFKVIQEDGSYFFPFAMINGGQNFFLNYNPQDTVFKRLFVGGEFLSLFTSVYRSIRDSLGYVFNQLTNVGVIPKEIDLFSAYRNSLNRYTGAVEDRTSKVYEISDSNKDYLEQVEVNGIWQIIKLIVDNQIDSRRLNNGELSNPEGSILDLVSRICHDTFVEFFGDTYGDQFVFVARQPPFTKKQIQDYFENNQYITIESENVSRVTLSWTEQFYTWYQLQPATGLYGQDQFIAGTTIPIVYFEDMAQRFGMHKKSVADNYLPYEILDGITNKENLDAYRKALANDMKYVIETNFVLPFTRRGTIVLNGDRRIKKNTWIYFRPTNEIFYVKSVSNSVVSSKDSIQRTTTLFVERGMIRDYVLENTYKQIGDKKVLVNYYDIVNLDVIYDGLVIKISDNEMQVSNGGANKQLVNKDLFEFFYSRKQFDK